MTPRSAKPQRSRCWTNVISTSQNWNYSALRSNSLRNVSVTKSLKLLWIKPEDTIAYISTNVLLINTRLNHFLFMLNTAGIIKMKLSKIQTSPDKWGFRCLLSKHSNLVPYVSIIIFLIKFFSLHLLKAEINESQKGKKDDLEFWKWPPELLTAMKVKSEMAPCLLPPSQTLLPLSSPETTDLDLQASCEWGHPALAKFGQHRGQHGEQHEGVLGVLLHGAQAPWNLFIICQPQIQPKHCA